MREIKTVVQMRFSGGMGGAENVAFSLASILSQKIDNSIIYLILENRSGGDACDSMVEKLKESGARYRVFYIGRRFSLNLLRQLGAALREDGVQIVHAHCYKSAFYSLIIKQLRSTPLEKIVFTLHGLFESLSLNMAFISFINLMDIFCVDRVIGCSREIASRYLQYPFMRGKVEVIQNGLLMDSRHTPERVASCREEMREKMSSLYGLDNGALWVAGIGRLAEQKNFSLYLKTVRDIRDSGGLNGKAQFLVVGEGKLMGALKRRAKELGVGDMVFFTSYIADMDMLFTSIDLLLVTSLWEGTPMCVLEAMAYGRAVVAADVGGIPDVIEHCVNGYLVSSLDSAVFARETLSLLNDGGKRRLTGKRAYESVKNDFSQAVWRDKHINMYQKVLESC